MSIRKILVPLAGADRDQVALESSAVAARHLGAHVEALFVRPDPSDAMPFVGEGIAGPVVQDILVAARDAADQAAARARTQVKTLSEQSGLPVVETPQGPGGSSLSFTEDMGPFGEVVAAHSLLSDIITFVTPKADEGYGFSDALQQCLMSNGQPIFLVPESTIASVGRHVTIGWDGSAEASHAVRGALPFLHAANRIDIMTVTGGPKETTKLDPLADYLAYHGLECTEHVVDPEGHPVGEVLMGHAQGNGSDLVVMGGYGHSRIRELILGGATRHVIHNASVPVLLAH